MPDQPWYVWMALGAFVYAMLRRIVPYAVHRYKVRSRPRMIVSVWQTVSRSKEPAEKAPTVWERLSSDE